jgi:hypothetical protein
MKVYSISGIVEYVEIGECECCGQDTEHEREKRVEFEIEAADEQAAQELGLTRAREILQERNRHVEIDGVQWKNKKGVIALVREVSEAEKMRRAGAPTLF